MAVRNSVVAIERRLIDEVSFKGSKLVEAGWQFSFSKLRKPGIVWKIASAVVVSSVGLISKAYFGVFNRWNVINVDQFHDLLDNRSPNVPLLTLSNHTSCIDDPGLWASMKFNHLLNAERVRWSLPAHDICFKNKFHGYFFLLGKCVPVVRGEGIYQSAMDFCVERLARGEWVHIFPEGRVNVTKDFVRLKWGFARLIYDPPVTPIVLPIWHVGMDRALPNCNRKLTFNNNITVNFADPIDLLDTVNDLKQTNTILNSAYKLICDKVQSELVNIKVQTLEAHDLYYS